MKKLLIVLSLFTTFSLAACNNQEAAPDDSSQGTITVYQEKEALQKENDDLKQKVSELEASTNNQKNEELMENIRDTLNLSFKVLSAMSDKDFDYLQSVAAPDVKISKDSETLTTEIGEIPLLKPINLKELESMELEEDHSCTVQKPSSSECLTFFLNVLYTGYISMWGICSLGRICRTYL